MEAEPLIKRLHARQNHQPPLSVFDVDRAAYDCPLCIVISGMGLQAAEKTMQCVFDHYTPDLVINCGIAGSLSGCFKPGTILAVSETGLATGETNGAAINWLANHTFEGDQYSAVRLVSVDKPLFDGERKNRLQPHAQLVDMEAAVIARVCFEHQTPCKILKIVSDDAENRQLLLDNLHPFSEQLAAHIYPKINHWIDQRCPV